MDPLNRTPEQLNRSIGQRVEAKSREIARRFGVALNDIRELLSAVFEKYESGGILTLEDMARYDRLTTLFREIDFAMARNYRDIQPMIYDALGFSYAESFSMTAWAIESVVAADLAYSAASNTQILAAINMPIDKLTLPQRLQQNRANVIKNIRRNILVGLNDGHSYQTMINAVKPILNGDAAKAANTVRTESHRVMEGGKHDAVQHANDQGVIMEKTWRTVQDERVRRHPPNVADHKMLDGVALPMDGQFKGLKGRGSGPGHMGHASEDCNCRCFLTYAIKEVRDLPDRQYTERTLEQWKEAKQQLSA